MQKEVQSSGLEDRKGDSGLDEQDLLILHLALDLLAKQTENSLSQSTSGVKRLSMLTMRRQIANAREKLKTLERAI